MKHMNPKMARLLYEGFSINTLIGLNNRQLNALYERVKKSKKETKEAELLLDPNSSEDMNLAKEKGLVTPDGKIKTKMESEVTEKSVSKKQRGLMGAAYSVEKGDKKLKDIPSSYRGKVEDLVGSMSKKQLKDFASTKDKELEEGDKFIQKATKKMEKKGTEGKFGSWCKRQGLDSDGEVTKKCISAALKSDDSSVVKMANFAKNIGGFKGSKHTKKKESDDEVKKLEESILNIINNYNNPTITKSQLFKTIKSYKR